MKNFFIKLSKSTTFWLILLLALSFFLRAYRLGEKSFVADEFLGVNAVYGYLQTGEWKRWDFNRNEPMVDREYPKSFLDFDFKGKATTYTRAWIYNWQTAQVLKFLPWQKESSYRLISVLWGVFTVWAVYFFGLRFLKNRKIAWIGALLMAISIGGIEYSRKMRMYAMFVPVFFIFTYYLFEFFESQKKLLEILAKIREKTSFDFIYLVPVVFLGLLSAHIHLLTVNIVPVILLYCFLILAIFYKKASFSKIFFNKYGLILSLALIGGVFLSVFSLQGRLFMKEYLQFKPHFSYLSKTLADYEGGFFAFALILVGSFFVILKKEKGGIFLFSCYWAILFSAIFLWNQSVGEQYILFARPFQVLLLASGLVYGLELIKENFAKKDSKLVNFCLVLILITLPNWSIFWSEDGPYRQVAESSEPNYRKVFGYFNKKSSDKDLLITREFRNFYYAGRGIAVYSFGGERTDKDQKRISLGDIEKLKNSNPTGWIIYSDNDRDFISEEAEEFIKKNFTRVSNASVRGPVSVYRW